MKLMIFKKIISSKHFLKQKRKCNKFKKYNKNFKEKIINIKPIVKFCVFAGRQKNMKILQLYIDILLDKKIINQYHIFDFSRNKNDKYFLYESYTKFHSKYPNRIFLHHYKENNFKQSKLNQYDWSPFYKIISNKLFYKNSVVIKCDDDILFIDILGLKNAIRDRVQDKKSFLIHTNCINNNICSYYHQHIFSDIKNDLSLFPKGGILGPTFKNSFLAYNMHNSFTNDVISNHDLTKYYIPSFYLNHRISINFILLNGDDCKYFKNTSFDDEYELSSYYPEKLNRPNKVFGYCICSHFSYSLQEKILNRNNNLMNLYVKLSNTYLKNINTYQDIKYILLNTYKVNNYGTNKFYINNWIQENFVFKVNQEYFYIDYFDSKINLQSNKKTYFNIYFIQNDIIEIQLGIYTFNPYHLNDDFKNRNILLKLLYNNQENKIKLIKTSKSNHYYLQFIKSKWYISVENKQLILTHTPKTSIEIIKIKKTYDKIWVKRILMNKKIYYKNLYNNHFYTNFYLGWGCEDCISILSKDK